MYLGHFLVGDPGSGVGGGKRIPQKWFRLLGEIRLNPLQTDEAILIRNRQYDDGDCENKTQTHYSYVTNTFLGRW